MAALTDRTIPNQSAGRRLLRYPYLVVALVAFLLLGADAIVALGNPVDGVDVAAERNVQQVAWGPLLLAFGAVDWFEGLKQVAGAVLGVLAVFIWHRRGTFLMIWGALSAGAYTGIELLVRRPRPGADLVHVIRHTSGFGFPSGHVLFFTWFLTFLLLILGRKYLPRGVYLAACALAGLVVLVVAIGRVYTAEHWPTDVLAGLLLGIGWIALGLSIRRLSDPVLNEKEVASHG